MSSDDGWAGPKLGSGLCSSHVVSVTSSSHHSTEAPNVGQVRVSSTPASVYQPVRCPRNSAVRAPLSEVLPSIRIHREHLQWQVGHCQKNCLLQDLRMYYPVAEWTLELTRITLTHGLMDTVTYSP